MNVIRTSIVFMLSRNLHGLWYAFSETPDRQKARYVQWMWSEANVDICKIERFDDGPSEKCAKEILLTK